MKYTPAQSPLEIRAHGTQAAVVVEVADHGCGFAEEDHELIFQKFYRGQRHSSTQGTGLGLAICRGIVAAHGGRIWIDRRQDGTPGAVVHFSLPLVAPAAAASAAMP